MVKGLTNAEQFCAENLPGAMPITRTLEEPRNNDFFFLIAARPQPPIAKLLYSI
jgi:hypothetical protein